MVRAAEHGIGRRGTGELMFIQTALLIGGRPVGRLHDPSKYALLRAHNAVISDRGGITQEIGEFHLSEDLVRFLWIRTVIYLSLASHANQ